MICIQIDPDVSELVYLTTESGQPIGSFEFDENFAPEHRETLLLILKNFSFTDIQKPTGDLSEERIDGRITYEEFHKEFELMANKNLTLPLALTWPRAWILFSLLQLALRHPCNIGPSAEIGRDIAQNLQRLLLCEDVPILKEVARRGWESQYDVIEEIEEP
jgi:hypothetical protein